MVLVVVMSILSPCFLSWINIANLMGQMAVPLIVVAVSATVMLQYGIVAGVLVSLLIGPAVGWMNGMVTIKGRIPSVIVTLGTTMMARPLTFVTTGGKVFSELPE